MENCPHCGKTLFRLTPDGQRVKAATSCLVLHKSGEVEINCPKCKLGVIIPLQSTGETMLKKAKPRQRHTLRKG